MHTTFYLISRNDKCTTHMAKRVSKVEAVVVLAE